MKILKFIILSFFIPVSCFSQELKIACAANFISPMKIISKTFEKEKNIKVITTFGSTGMLYTQIKNKAPFDIFFAADTKRPKLLVEKKNPENFFLYAKGKAVLWTRKENLKIKNSYIDVLNDSVTVSIAFPKAAPYGKVVIDMLEEKKTLNKFESKFVYGKNVAQSFQYAYSKFSDSGFCALSQALSEKGKQGKFFLLKDAREVVQGGCILTSEKSAGDFLEFLKRSEDVLKKYGYTPVSLSDT